MSQPYTVPLCIEFPSIIKNLISAAAAVYENKTTDTEAEK